MAQRIGQRVVNASLVLTNSSMGSIGSWAADPSGVAVPCVPPSRPRLHQVHRECAPGFPRRGRD